MARLYYWYKKIVFNSLKSKLKTDQFKAYEVGDYLIQLEAELKAIKRILQTTNSRKG